MLIKYSSSTSKYGVYWRKYKGGWKMKSYMELMQNINLELTEGREWEDGNATYCTLLRKYIYLVLTNKNISLAQ